MRTNAAIVQQPVGQSPWDLTGDQPSPQTIAMFHRPSHSGPTIDRKPQCCRANAIPRRTTERSRLTHWQTPQFRNRTWPEHDGCAHNGRSAADRGIRIHCLALGGVDLTSAAGCANQATAGRSAPAIEWRGKRGKPRETLRHAPPNDHAGSRFDQVARNLVVRASNHLVKLDQTKRQHQIVQRRQSFPGQENQQPASYEFASRCWLSKLRLASRKRSAFSTIHPQRHHANEQVHSRVG